MFIGYTWLNYKPCDDFWKSKDSFNLWGCKKNNYIFCTFSWLFVFIDLGIYSPTYMQEVIMQKNISSDFLKIISIFFCIFGFKRKIDAQEHKHMKNHHNHVNYPNLNCLDFSQ